MVTSSSALDNLSPPRDITRTQQKIRFKHTIKAPDNWKPIHRRISRYLLQKGIINKKKVFQFMQEEENYNEEHTNENYKKILKSLTNIINNKMNDFKLTIKLVRHPTSGEFYACMVNNSIHAPNLISKL